MSDVNWLAVGVGAVRPKRLAARREPPLLILWCRDQKLEIALNYIWQEAKSSKLKANELNHKFILAIPNALND